MKYRYIGDRDRMTAFGYQFRHDVLGDFTPDVTNEHALKKLAGNNHFEAVEEDKRPNVQAQLQAVSAAQTLAELDALSAGEDRKTVLDAVEKKRAKLAQP